MPAVVVAALAAVLVGCSSPTVAPDQAASPPGVPGSAAPSAPATAEPSTTPPQTKAPVHDDEVLHEYPDLDVQPWEETAEDALHTADEAVRVYLDPTSATWWEDLSALLSAQAATVYGQVDPTVIPAGQVSGDAAVVDSAGDGMLATVRVPTSVGDLDVLLTRATAQDGGGWEVEQINPAGDS